jgi:hypothetical protein
MSVIENLAVADSVVVNGESEVTATIKDVAGGAGVSAAALTWTVDPVGAGTIIGGELSTDGGAVNATFKAGADPVDKVTITLAVTGEEGVSASVNTQVTAAVGDEVIQSIDSSIGNLPNDHSLSTVITVTVVDSSGAPAKGTALTWTVSAEGALDDGEMDTQTDENGKASVRAKMSELAESAFSVTATLTGSGDTRSIRIGVVTPLRAPTVLNASEDDDYVLDEHDLAFGVGASVEIYAGAAVGDTVTFFWGNIEERFYINNLLEDLPRHIDVTKMGEEALTVGEHVVYYTVLSVEGNLTPSSALPINIVEGDGNEATLPAPTIINENGDFWINISEANKGVDIEFSYPDMAETDFVTLYWTGYDESENLVPGASATLSNKDFLSITSTLIKARIEPDYFFPNNVGYKGRAECFYSVYKVDGGGNSHSVTAEVGIATYSA